MVTLQCRNERFGLTICQLILNGFYITWTTTTRAFSSISYIVVAYICTLNFQVPFRALKRAIWIRKAANKFFISELVLRTVSANYFYYRSWAQENLYIKTVGWTAAPMLNVTTTIKDLCDTDIDLYFFISKKGGNTTS